MPASYFYKGLIIGKPLSSDDMMSWSIPSNVDWIDYNNIWNYLEILFGGGYYW